MLQVACMDRRQNVFGGAAAGLEHKVHTKVLCHARG